MLKRKITKNIEEWYGASTKALLIDGARQIGKTTIINDFIKDKKSISFNLVSDFDLLEAFNSSKNENELKIKLLNFFDDNLYDIVFIDEIQCANDAISSIKFLLSLFKCRFIFSGSLLGVKMKNIASVPVGFLNVINMYPMDFEEFIDAVGIGGNTKAYLKECFEGKKEIDQIVHEQMINVFRLYLVVGGMPEAVQTFITTKNIKLVNNILSVIDSNYRLDISRYNDKDKILIQDIYDLIPSELNNQNKRFVLKNLNEKSRFYKYESSFAWIKHSGVGLFVHNVDNPVYPLLASKERTLFKLFPNDVGLLTYKLFYGNQISVLNKEVFVNFGAIYESFVAQELTAHGFQLYYDSDKKRGEIDFLIEKDSSVIPIEVKSGKDYKRHNALENLLSNEPFNIDEGYVFCNQNIRVVGKKVYLPIYLVMFFTTKKPLDDQIVNFDISKLID